MPVKVPTCNIEVSGFNTLNTWLWLWFCILTAANTERERWRLTWFPTTHMEDQHWVPSSRVWFWPCPGSLQLFGEWPSKWELMLTQVLSPRFLPPSLPLSLLLKKTPTCAILAWCQILHFKSDRCNLRRTHISRSNLKTVLHRSTGGYTES